MGGGGFGAPPAIVSPESTFRYHTAAVEDVDWHGKDANLIGSCGDDGLICLWDARGNGYGGGGGGGTTTTTPMHVVRNAHDGDVNGMEFHPTNEHLLASCGSTTTMTTRRRRGRGGRIRR